jgi:hypothetical protein
MRRSAFGAVSKEAGYPSGNQRSVYRCASSFRTERHENHGKVNLLTVVSRRHFFSVAPNWCHVTGMMRADLGKLRGFVGERR